MSDHNPELCARVARVLGLTPHINAEEWGDRCEVVTTSNQHERFMPDTDPADAWRVLEYLRDISWTVTLHTEGVLGKDVRCCSLRRAATDYASGDGPTDMIALCNAVAALGGEHE